MINVSVDSPVVVHDGVQSVGDLYYDQYVIELICRSPDGVQSLGDIYIIINLSVDSPVVVQMVLSLWETYIL